jgi:hypothetical protein
MATQAKLYVRYPLPHVVLYDGVTALHFLLGGLGLWLGYGGSWKYVLPLLYLAFAFGQMVVIMPLRVCPNCSYYRLEGGRCVSALNLLSRRIAAPGKPTRFRKRAQGVLCHNNLYLTALAAPIPLILLGLILNFSTALVAILAGVTGLLIVRFLVLFPRIACVHCVARERCPNAETMGLNRRI